MSRPGPDAARLDGTRLDGAKVAAARLWAVTGLPYLASALFAASVRSAPGSGTIAIDRRWQIDADPAVVQQLEVTELGRLLVHLVAHALREHATRAGTVGAGSDTELGTRAWWARCADAEINDDLRVDDFVPASAPDQPGDLGAADGGLAEAYFANRAVGEPAWDCGSGVDGVPRPWESADPRTGLDPAQSELLCLGVAADVQRSHHDAPGSVPGGWLRWAEAVRPSRADWRRVLAAEIRSAVAAVSGSVDYTYRRPSRRSRASGSVVLPSLFRPVPEVAVVLDTSGSMHQGLLERALAEVEGLLSRTGLRSTRVLAVDTAVQAVRRVSHASQVQLAGGGGTDMGAGLVAASALRPRPSLVIVLTDAMTPWPDRPPPGIRVVVGVLTEPGFGPDLTPPAWARTVIIDDVPGD